MTYEMKSSLFLKRYAGYGLLAFSLLILVLTITRYPHQVDDVSTENTFLDRADYKEFYRAPYAADTQSPPSALPQGKPKPSSHESDPVIDSIRGFVQQYGLEKSRILEVGAGVGALQDVVADYTALDISSEQQRFFHKPFVEASATSMPFKDREFDAIWTINVLEHVPKPEQALSEMRRVLRDKGLLYLEEAWQCPAWAAQGYQVRPYSDFGIQGKLIKASIPLRELAAYRVLYTFPIRLLRFAASHATASPTSFHYNLLTPNYERFWQPDSDAVNSMDPYEVVLWFTTRGDEIVSYEGVIHPFFVRTGALVIRINKRAK